MHQIRYQQNTTHHARPMSTTAATASTMSLPGLTSFQISPADRPRLIGTRETTLSPSGNALASCPANRCAETAGAARGALSGDRK